jgi:hypothetical protein
MAGFKVTTEGPDMPFRPVQEKKYTHSKNRIHPKIHPPKHGCTWMQKDA